MDKKQLYESIMKSVAKEVKKALNENAPFMQGHSLNILCDDADRALMQDIFERAELEVSEKADDEMYTVEVEEEDPITLAGITGYVTGNITYSVRLHTYRDSDAEDHYWYETEITDIKLYDYDLTLYDEDNNQSYEIYLYPSDMPRGRRDENIEDTEVHRNYLKLQELKKLQERERLWEENDRKQKEYERNVKAYPDNYIKIANDYMAKASDNYNYWDLAAEAEEIFRILGMTKELETAHNIAVSGYHREEAAAGLL